MASPAIPMHRSAFPIHLSRDFDKVFFDAYAKHEPEWVKIANVKYNSKDAYIRQGNMAGIGALPEVEYGQPLPRDGAIPGNEKQVWFQKFGLTLEFNEEAIEDDQTGNMRALISRMGEAAAYTCELIVADILNSGFTTARLGFDGKPLFAADHALLNGQTYSNVASPAGALSQSTLEMAMQAFDKTPNERGLPRLVKPALVVVPPELRPQGLVLLKSEYNSENANMQYNTVGNGGLSLLVNHFFSSTTAYFMLSAKDAHDISFTWRKSPTTKASDDPDTGNLLYRMSMRGIATFFDWRGTYANPGA